MDRTRLHRSEVCRGLPGAGCRAVEGFDGLADRVPIEDHQGQSDTEPSGAFGRGRRACARHQSWAARPNRFRGRCRLRGCGSSGPRSSPVSGHQTACIARMCSSNPAPRRFIETPAASNSCSIQPCPTPTMCTQADEYLALQQKGRWLPSEDAAPRCVGVLSMAAMSRLSGLRRQHIYRILGDGDGEGERSDVQRQCLTPYCARHIGTGCGECDAPRRRGHDRNVRPGHHK